jgi:DNA-binding NarL/FixJ family response regulator
MATPRVVLADDHTLFVDALQNLLAGECDVVGCVSDGRQLLDAVGRLRPNIAIVDIAMPFLNGVDAARQIRRTYPEVGIIIVTANEDQNLAAEAFRAGASSYVLKRCAAPELLTAVRETMKRRSYVTPLVAAGVIEAMSKPQPGPDERLTRRQREVIQLVAEGHSLKETATILAISTSTVTFHKYQVMSQLHLKTTADLIQYAVKHHIV